MGLNCTHGAFDGAYSAFNRFRQAVCKAAGGSFPPHTDEERLAELGLTIHPHPYLAHHPDGVAQEPGVADGRMWYVPDEITRETHPGLYIFLEHQDCEDEINPENCVQVADELEKLLPAIEDAHGGGHIEREGGYRKVTEKFIAGCRLAASKGESLEFH